MKFDDCVAFTLRREGGLSQDRADRGNWLGPVLVGSNMGISAATLAIWLRERDLPSSPRDVAAAMQRLDVVTARGIYQHRYWNVLQGDALPAGIDLMVFDHGVNRGTPASAVVLQRALDVPCDGVIGPVTIAACLRSFPGGLIHILREAQEADYRSLTSFPRWGAGWLARLQARATLARDMATRASRALTGDTHA